MKNKDAIIDETIDLVMHTAIKEMLENLDILYKRKISNADKKRCYELMKNELKILNKRIDNINNIIDWSEVL